MENILFLDTEIGVTDRKIHDIGAIDPQGRIFHSGKVEDLFAFVGDTPFVCGHNIIHHDLRFLTAALQTPFAAVPIDTLYLSPLLFPKRPYHALLKDDKLQTEELNNPVNDCRKAAQLFEDEIAAFGQLPEPLQRIFYTLLHEQPEFSGFFEYLHFVPASRGARELFGLFRGRDGDIKHFFRGRICEHADVLTLMEQRPVELAYALALIHAGDSLSITPPWTLKNYPHIYNVLVLLRNHPCEEGCPYCRERLNADYALKKYFGYPSYRSYNGEPLQQRAVQGAIDGKSLLVVFPTGGGKSITFQIPALLAGDNAHGLTVVISPLQSLMKDQVDNLRAAGIMGAVTVNGLLSPVERAEAFRQIADGTASLLYIAPEMLRSRTMEKALMSRNVVRFVIDEAHCFSAWGQDFRIDYLYIGDFIRKLQKNKANGVSIAVSCFTATAKQKVISDIRDYFKDKLDLDLEILASNAARENLTYNVLYKENDEEKYVALRNLIEQKGCPTIVYVSRTKRTIDLARKLTADGFPARPFNGKMPSKDKIENQEAFIANEVNVIVATSAFGMGVDKSDVGLVVHFDISDSLENYVQESGRAGRNANIHADCYVLYNESDLDKHFILLNQTKISLGDIQQVWQAIKRMSGSRKRLCCSALEIARQAGWDCSVADVETRVKTAVSSLENTGYIQRGNNMPRVYATGIMARNANEAVQMIDASQHLNTELLREKAKRIIKKLISSRSVARAGNDDAESRVDYLADILGYSKEEVIDVVNKLREDGILADSQDMSAYILKDDNQHRTMVLLERFSKLERFLLGCFEENTVNECNLKEINAQAADANLSSVSVKSIRTLLYFLSVKQYIRKEEYAGISSVKVMLQLSKEKILAKYDKRIAICKFIVDEFYAISRTQNAAASSSQSECPVTFSLVGLHKKYTTQVLSEPVSLADVEDALLYLSTIGAIRLEGGFLVLYNRMEINRLVMDNRIRYKRDDYASLAEYYKQKIQQIHIVGTFANMMVRDYQAALQFVSDYFQMDYRKFINRYFEPSQIERLSRNMTSQRYQKLFGCLSPLQQAIIDDDESKHIVVLAGPGSGKTRVLVHKLAAILTLEDVKHEQLLMVTFSRAAATEFKLRLKELIGNAANFVEIKTFHSYCFDLIGRIGNLEDSANVVKRAVDMIQHGDVEPERISKSVLVIDEAQDMDQDEYNLVRALMEVNDGMRVIAVGDDDQNIYEFRGSDSKYMRALVTDYEARVYELIENFRSEQHIVDFSNAFVQFISHRLKNKAIVAIKPEPGLVELTSFSHRHMEEAITEVLLRNRFSGSSCVMTVTNDEVFRILGLLLKKGIHAKLIQSTDGFSLSNLAEVRYFLKKLSITKSAAHGSACSPVISADEWHYAKEQLCAEYADSSCLDNCLQMLSVFEATNARMYRSDLLDFIRESKYEDFYKEEKGALYVSTIHRTKGREFDHVYLMLNSFIDRSDADLRRLYVAMTRARCSLHIYHFNTPLLARVSAPYAQLSTNTGDAQEAQEIALQLTHKDVFLDFFLDKKKEILRLHSGAPLQLCPGGLQVLVQGRLLTVVRYSKAFNDQLSLLYQKGYVPQRADIRFIVAWKPEDAEEETAVILPNLYLVRK